MNTVKHIIMTFVLLLLWSTTQAEERIVFYHNDIMGSPVAATDESGNVLWREDYAPYGKKLGDDMEAAVEKVGYTGHRYDMETGLVYAGARMYDPALARFMGIDPVSALSATASNPIMFNRYAYANNNPYKYVDPDGEAGIFALALAVVAFVGGEVIALQIFGGDKCNGCANSLMNGLPGPLAAGATVRYTSQSAKYTDETADLVADMSKGGVQANKAAGDAFEAQIKGQLQRTDTDVAQQVTIKTQSGVRTRVDLLSRDATGAVKCTECKASATAPLTKNQKLAFPEIEQSGGVVVGKGKPGFPGGTEIPPTKVDIVRP